MPSGNLAARSADDAPNVPSFEVIFRSHFAYVWNSLRRLGVHERDLEDLTHDVFLHVYRQFDQYEPSRGIRPWLFGFALRVASDYRRRASHRAEIFDDGRDRPDHAPSPLDRAVTAEAAVLAAAALEQLEINRRAVFVLHEIDGCSVPEIARALEIPLNTAYSRLRLAREHFASVVAHLRGDRR